MGYNEYLLRWTSFYSGHVITIRGSRYFPTNACAPNYQEILTVDFVSQETRVLVFVLSTRNEEKET